MSAFTIESYIIEHIVSQHAGARRGGATTMMRNGSTRYRRVDVSKRKLPTGSKGRSLAERGPMEPSNVKNSEETWWATLATS